MPAALPRLGPWAPGLLAAAALALLGGLQLQASLPDPRPWALAALAGGLLAWRWRWVLGPALLAAVLAWGSGWSAAALAPRLPPAWEGRDLVVEAVVDGLPQSVDGFGGAPLWRLTLRPLGPGRDGAQTLPLPARLSVWHETEAPPRGGERWRFLLRLKRLHALQNPGLPDAELWMLERGIGAQGSVRQAERLAAAPGWSLQGARQALRDRLDAHVSGERARALIAGLLLGDQAALPPADWALLRDAGVVHLFAISGLHITAFAWGAAWLIRRAWPAAWALRWPAPGAARWGGLLCATAYALLAGWGVPAQRTVALLAMVTLLAGQGRLWPWPLTLLVAALPIALADPWALVQPGFWLSFAAVALLMQQGHAPGPRSAVKELLHTQAVATLGLAPLSLVFFGQVSVVGALANLVAVPLVTLLLTPLALLGALLPPLWQLAAAGGELLFALLQPLVALPGAVLGLPQAPLPLQALALLGLPVVALRLPRGLRAAGLLCMLPLFLWRPALPPPGAFELQVLDVGQGSAVLLRTAGHQLLFDAGPRWGPRNDAGARLLLPTLRAAGVSRLDALVLSHGDADHAGGAASLRAGMATGTLWRSPDARLAPLGGRLCAGGMGWDWDGVRFRFLHPGPAAGLAASKNANASSCVLHVEAADGASLLMPADIGAAEEAQLQAPPSTVLLLPHHGSAGSSSTALLDAVRPQLAFAQAGYRNRHGHPALATQNRLRERGIALLSSADCGAWRWRSSEPPGREGCWRAQRRRYWHSPLPADTSELAGPELRADTIPP